MDELWREHVLPGALARYEELATGLAYATIIGEIQAENDSDDVVVADALRLVKHQHEECEKHLDHLRAT